MFENRRRVAVTALLALVFSVALATGALVVTADSQYDLTVSDVTDTPSDTVEFEGDEYEVSAVAVRDPGDSITATASLPDEEFSSIDFLLYKSLPFSCN